MKLKYFIVLTILINTTFAQNKLPEWAKGVVWYQIFPERFANSDLSNDPEAEKVFINDKSIPKDWKVTNWTSNWFEQSDWEQKLGGQVRNHLTDRRYGGDIQGIINRLDYLKDMGVGAIYLNPVFEAVSMHKYDGSSYHHIDVNFGPDPVGDKKLMCSEIPENPATWKWTEADKLFLKLVDEVHERGMKIIIDGVFNHTGVQFWAFQDIVNYQEQSKYKDWFIIDSFDDPVTATNEFDYKGWWGHKSLPEFNRTIDDLVEGPKQYIYHSTQKWMDPNGDGNPSDGIDGWRLDVAREVPIGFWKQWSKLVKSINNQSIIVGELWELSADFVSSNGPFDALMNYDFAFAVNDFFVADKNKISVDEFIERLKRLMKLMTLKIYLYFKIFCPAIDTERLSSLIQNPDRKYEHDANEDNPNYNPGKPGKEVYEKQKLIAAFQILYRGASMIYYGDEVGMWGADDPHDRKPMIWDDMKYENEVIDETSGFKKGFGSYTVEQNKDLLNYYKDIIAIKNECKELKLGTIKFIFSDNDKKAFAFESVLGDKKTICIFNLGDDKLSIKFDFPLRELYSANSVFDKYHRNIYKTNQLILIETKSFGVFKAN
ncbi:MAG: glycoside hydrolase family 13 protein [Ignavibacteriales bacterium]|nr:glycoside hydrolase family 13 protein [Ignavibacteriales bacterium]